jgi:hypothetical protein
MANQQSGRALFSFDYSGRCALCAGVRGLRLRPLVQRGHTAAPKRAAPKESKAAPKSAPKRTDGRTQEGRAKREQGRTKSRTTPTQTALHCTAPHRTTNPNRTANPNRTSPHRTPTAPHRTAPLTPTTFGRGAPAIEAGLDADLNPTSELRCRDQISTPLVQGSHARTTL